MQNTNIDKTLISQFVSEQIVNALTNLLEKEVADNSVEDIQLIANEFGDSDSFATMLGTDSAAKEKTESKILSSFHNNLKLLVQKTWVEKDDETLKEQVLLRLEAFCTEIQNHKYTENYNAFIEILYDVVYLLFGSQAQKEDFTEYAFRIDPWFGIFWWYVDNLPKEQLWNSEKIRVVLFLGMIFLANY